MNRETHTVADAERALRALQRDPAAVGYGAHLRRQGLLGPASLLAVSPATEVAEAEREMRHAVAGRPRR